MREEALRPFSRDGLGEGNVTVASVRRVLGWKRVPELSPSPTFVPSPGEQPLSFRIHQALEL